MILLCYYAFLSIYKLVLLERKYLSVGINPFQVSSVHNIPHGRGLKKLTVFYLRPVSPEATLQA